MMLTTPIVLLILPTAPIVLLFTLSALLTELKLDKARVKWLKEVARSHGNCRHIYPLLAGTAAVAADMT